MKSRNPGFIPGNMWITCDRCGFAYRRSEMKKEWTGLIVCEKDWEPRHPQDFVRGVEDTIAPEGLSNPEVADTFAPDSDNDVAIDPIVGTHGGTIS